MKKYKDFERLSYNDYKLREVLATEDIIGLIMVTREGKIFSSRGIDTPKELFKELLKDIGKSLQND